METTNSCTPALPLIDQWKLRNQRNQSDTSIQRHNIKFSIISKQSLPFLGTNNKKEDRFKGFRINGHKQNLSYHLVQRNRKRTELENSRIVSEQRKNKIKLEKLKNKRNHQKHRLQIQYQNLRINTLIQCAAQELIQKQNRMLNGMM